MKSAVPAKKDLTPVEITVSILRENGDKSILVSKRAAGGDAVWVPFSQVRITPIEGRRVKMEMPKWLAEDRKLL